MKNLNLFTLIFSLMLSVSAFAKEYHVSVNGNDENTGTVANPFKTISKAVEYAYPGDVITVHEGTYREWINPIRSGNSDLQRIVFRAAPGEKVKIKGSEIITGWKKLENGAWKVEIPNSFFGDYNPYKDSINGDWFGRMGRVHHTGEVFLNGKSFWEKSSLDEVISPKPVENPRYAEGSTYTWYCENNDETTTIWANFHKYNPNKELVEISTRWTCFYPTQKGINYLTIKGFEISQAATQWGAPTAHQVGMIATHWNKGWIIEDNQILNSRCSGITLGKEKSSGHNVWSADRSIDGSIHYIECTFNTLRIGWDKENVGSHIVRNNEISECQQTAICGSMGAAFSIIEGNYIHDIHYKRQFNGAEMAGIKFHAAIDATIRNNRFHNCNMGLWLDWMTQGTRISSNLFHDNDLDLFLEVNHGPTIVDNNIMISNRSIATCSQGGAFVNNLIGGRIHEWADGRFTPYHLPHSTQVAALSTIYSGDDRYYNNIFIGVGDETGRKDETDYGTARYNDAKLPVFFADNIYYHGAKPCDADKNHKRSNTFNPDVKLVEAEDGAYLHLQLNDEFFKNKGEIISTAKLGKAKVPNAVFENPDGTPIVFNKDILGKIRTNENVIAGPFKSMKKGEVTIKVW